MCHSGRLTRCMSWKPPGLVHHMPTAIYLATTVLLNTQHTLQAMLQTPSTDFRSSQQTCDAGTAEQQMQQHYACSTTVDHVDNSDCREEVLGSSDISVSPAAAPVHTSGYQGHPVGHGHHWLHSCQAFPARRSRPVPLPHVPVQSTEHRQCHLGLCQVRLQPWQV